MRYPGIKFSMIPNGCDNIKKTVLQPPNGLAKKKYILYMGRIVPEKGIHKLILAYKKISTDYPLIIAGPDQHASDYVKYLKSITDDHPKIHFVGSLSGEVKEQYLANSYLFVLPSEIEGLPIALLEAASYAVCPLVSNIPTAVEVLGTKELARGYVCDTGSIKELQTVLELALENEALSNQLGKVVQLHVEKHFNWDRITTQTFSVYKQCLGQ